MINFRKSNENLDTITVAEAKQYLAEGHFTEGSMHQRYEPVFILLKMAVKMYHYGSRILRKTE